MSATDEGKRLERIQKRTMELVCDNRWSPEARRLAGKCWLEAKDTAIGEVTVERLMAFAEEIFGAQHPGAKDCTEDCSWCGEYPGVVEPPV